MALTAETTKTLNYIRRKCQTKKRRPLLNSCSYLLRGYQLKTPQRLSRTTSGGSSTNNSPSSSKSV